MNRQELLRATARAHSEWSDRYADSIPARPEDSNPHNGRDSDYVEHHADRSAPPDLDDLLNRRLVELISSGQSWQRRAAERLRG